MPKSKRSKAKFQKAKAVQQNAVSGRVEPGRASTEIRTAKPVATATVLSAEKYRYIGSDLRNIGIIAGALIIILIIFAFILQ